MLFYTTYLAIVTDGYPFNIQRVNTLSAELKNNNYYQGLVNYVNKS